eukprot:CAMPEP_0172195206 /NCGR_PEP_ID=MMETSP1050-20130122/26064_1 /TAXON_ID=233186 /ORGANISM="Cryptomonas curvata, Strain CCAP979/52" /LENGTH=56 /DNA_ID=CAMNT_0012871213 /DNA_START=135 /DNA_END=302 /DNA_ORIENTATION=+
MSCGSQRKRKGADGADVENRSGKNGTCKAGWKAASHEQLLALQSRCEAVRNGTDDE